MASTIATARFATSESAMSESNAGRPSIYSDALAESILDKLAEGLSMVQICQADDMPGLRTVMRWAAEDANFGTEYARAREAQAEVMDDKILTAADGAKSDPAAARVQIDAYKWRAAKLAPKNYGDKIDVTSGGDKIERMDDVSMAVRAAALVRQALERDAEPE